VCINIRKLTIEIEENKAKITKIRADSTRNKNRKTLPDDRYLISHEGKNAQKHPGLKVIKMINFVLTFNPCLDRTAVVIDAV